VRPGSWDPSSSKYGAVLISTSTLGLSLLYPRLLVGNAHEAARYEALASGLDHTIQLRAQTANFQYFSPANHLWPAARQEQQRNSTASGATIARPGAQWLRCFASRSGSTPLTPLFSIEEHGSTLPRQTTQLCFSHASTIHNTMRERICGASIAKVGPVVSSAGRGDDPTPNPAPAAPRNVALPLFHAKPIETRLPICLFFLTCPPKTATAVFEARLLSSILLSFGSLCCHLLSLLPRLLDIRPTLVIKF
jgi:hypothetical protein